MVEIWRPRGVRAAGCAILRRRARGRGPRSVYLGAQKSGPDAEELLRALEQGRYCHRAGLAEMRNEFFFRKKNESLDVSKHWSAKPA